MSKTHILGIFTPFHCSTTSVWFRTTYFTSKTHVSGGFTPFHCHTRPIMKISIGCIKCTSLCLRNHFLFCHNEHAQSTISVKNSCFGWFHAISQPHLTRCKNRYRGTFKHEFMPLEPFLVFLQYRGAFKARDCASETISCLVTTNILNPQLQV